MPRLTRRKFLTSVGITATAAVLEACRAPATVQVTATPAPSPTPLPIQIPEMVLVEPGTFTMGSNDHDRDEYPVHPVRITTPYYIATHLVTFDEYDLYCELTGRPLLDDRDWGRGSLPAFDLCWQDAIEYCRWLNSQYGLSSCFQEGRSTTYCDFTANGYRPPTEAEWEFAARGGNASQGLVYAGSDDPHEVAWFSDNSGGRPHPVGEKTPNELGLYDMCGNVWEMCWDLYAWNYYILVMNRNAVNDDPRGAGPTAHVNRALRGGSFGSTPDDLRITSRGYDLPTDRGMYGIRLARTAAP